MPKLTEHINKKSTSPFLTSIAKLFQNYVPIISWLLALVNPESSSLHGLAHLPRIGWLHKYLHVSA